MEMAMPMQKRQKMNASKADKEEAPTETTHIRSSMNPDVTIVVGGKTFKEYSQSLCAWSSYFDAALRSGMQESNTKKFEFPKRNPEEWQLLMDLVGPFPSKLIDRSNVDNVLAWFDELGCMRGIAACDRVLHESLFPNGSPYTQYFDGKDDERLVRFTTDTLDLLYKSFQYNLPHSKTASLECCKNALEHHTEFFPKPNLERLTGCLKEFDECGSELWSILNEYIPDSISEEQKLLLVEKGLLHEILDIAMRRLEEEVCYERKAKKSRKAANARVKRHTKIAVLGVLKIVNKNATISRRERNSIKREVLENDFLSSSISSMEIDAAWESDEEEDSSEEEDSESEEEED